MTAAPTPASRGQRAYALAGDALISQRVDLFALRFPQPRSAVVQAEQFDDRRDVVFAADVIGCPACFRVKIMKVYFPCGHKLLSYAHREWQIGQTISVQVSDLTFPDVEEDHPPAVSFRRDSGPGGHFPLNLCGNRVRHDTNYIKR